jgi:protein gp37
VTTEISAFNESTGFWWGCTKISPGCDACYAESDCRSTGRGEEFYLKGWKLTQPALTPFRIWDKDAPRLVRPRATAWKMAHAFDRKAKSGKRRLRVFVNSMSDFFEKRDDLIPARERAWEVIRATPNVDWCILTKRHDNILRCLPDDYKKKPWPNVWLGISIEDQVRADLRLKHLVPIMKDLKPVIFWLAIEPLLGEIHIEEYLDTGVIKWAFAGAESDQEPRTARPCHTAWGESIVKQFQDRAIPIHWKQWGSWERANHFQRGKENIVMGRNGQSVTVSSKQDFDKQMKAIPEPCGLLHKRVAYEVNHEIFGAQVWESPSNYLDWNAYPEWDVVAEGWSKAGMYKPLKQQAEGEPVVSDLYAKV